MAEENKKTGPSLSGNSDSAREQLDLAEKTLKSQGDFNQKLKESNSELKKMIKSYDTIQGKLGSLSESSINIKEIEKSLNKLAVDRINTQNKLNRLEQSGFSESLKSYKSIESGILSVQKEIRRLTEENAQNVEGLSKEERERDKDIIQAKKNQLESLISQKEEQFQILNIEEQAYVNRNKTLKLIEEQEAYAKELLKIETAAKQNLGLSGGFAKILGDKLGVGKDVYGAMVEKAKELNGEEGKNLGVLQKRLMVLKAGLGAGVSSFTNKLKDPVALAGLMTVAIGGVISGLKAAFDYIVGIQDQTVKFARSLNLSTGEARKIKMEFASLSVSSGDLFINSQKMVESQMELVDALGVTNRLSNEILAANIKLKDIAGLDLETRKGIVETATITGQEAEALTKSILAQVVGLKQTTGIQFQNQKILKEAASQSGYLGLQFAKYPAQLTKSLLTVKAMGLELKQLDSMADSFLDFESSISKEFEAQLLTGKNINLAKARELFLNNDLAGAAAEITGQIGSAGDFLKLNRIQADSLAQAFGMSRDQMGDMLKQQELLSRLGAKQGDSAKEQLRIGLERFKNQKALTAAIGEEAYQNLINASSQEKIAAFVEKIKQSIADFVESSGIIDKIEGFIEYISKPENIRRIIMQVRDFFASAVEAVLQITNGVINAIDFITFGFAIDEEFERKFEAFSDQAGRKIRSLGGNFEEFNLSNKAAKGESSNNTTVINNYSEPSNTMKKSKTESVTNINLNIEGTTIDKTQLHPN